MNKHLWMKCLIGVWTALAIYDYSRGAGAQMVVEDLMIVCFCALLLDASNDRDQIRRLLDSQDGASWLVWSMQHGMYWRPQWNGYTHVKEEAGRYRYSEAAAIVRQGNYGAPPDKPNEAMIRDEV